MRAWGSKHVRSASRGRRWIAAALAASLVMGACSSDDESSGSSTPTTIRGTSTTATSTTGTSTTTGTSKGGGDGANGNNGDNGAALVKGVRLSEGTSSAGPATDVPTVDGTPLDDTTIQQIEGRLPAWELQDMLTTAFNWPTETRPAPVAGSTVDVAFPPATDITPPAAPTGPLHVTRVQPQGDVDIAPFVSITFDQPMVPVGTVGQVNAAAVPASIDPAVPGHWQWIGTQTLRFDADSDVVDRLPMATSFTVTVPKGTTSASGGVLADDATFDFTTPPVQVQSLQPQGDSLPLTPIFLATFDQRVDPAAVLATTHLRAGGDEVQIRLGTADELAADDSFSGTIASLPEGRWIAFRPVEALPTATDLSIEVGPGTPSAEGPATTATADTYSGRTYDPLNVVSVDCSYEPECYPGSGISIELNNEIDAATFDPSTIGVSPAIPGMVVAAYGTTISIDGATAGRTEYTITVPAGLTDVHGQQLGADEKHTVTTGKGAPTLGQFSQPFITLDPLAPAPTLPVVTVNHDDVRVRVFSVQPSDWPAYVQYVQTIFNAGDGSEPAAPSFAVLDDKVVQIASVDDQAVETSLDLGAYLPNGHGHIVVLVEPTEHYSTNDDDYWQNRPTITWAQATGIGLDALSDAESLHAWATNLADGKPLAGVSLGYVDGGAVTATTDADGLATLDLTGATALTATNGDDVALLPNSFYGGSWVKSPQNDQALWYVFDDRGVYKPGETVSLKGWIRRLTGSDAQLQLLADGATVGYTVTDGQGSQIGDGTATVNPLGGFDFTFDVPKDANLGFAYVNLTLNGVDAMPGASWTHDFQIQEFRTPEYEVGARNDSAGPYVQGDPLTLAVNANYYAGGPLGDAPVDWSVTTASASYSPPGWDDYTFGQWTPWWYSDFGGDSYATDYSTPGHSAPCCDGSGGDATSKEFNGVTDANGSHYLQVDVGATEDPDLQGLPVAVTAQASVTDLNRQTLASTTTALVHPAGVYVGLKSADTYVKKGDPLNVSAIVSDIDGKIATDRPVRMSVTRSQSVWQNGGVVEQQVDQQSCDVTSATDPVSCTFTTDDGGQYTITATVTDAAGRTSRTEFTRWVSGETTPPTRNVERQDLTIVPDLETYAPGTTAHLLVQAPFASGDAILTVTRNNIVSTTHFTVTDGSAIVDIPLADSDIPGVDVSIEVVGAVPRVDDAGNALPDAPLRPAFATGSMHLAVSTASRTLDVQVTPAADTVNPGTTTAVDVAVTDSGGQPVEGSELAVVVVDEAVLALSDYDLDDPLSAFYGQLPGYISELYGRDSIILTNPLNVTTPNADDGSVVTSTVPPGGIPGLASADTTAASTDEAYSQAAGGAVPAAPSINEGGKAADRDASGGAVAVRTNFDALAVWEPSVTTDASGHATIDVPLPDNLTRYRVMVVAVSGADHFGSGEANITARLPLMVRPSAPRFLNFGDTFQLPVLVQNQTDADMTVDVVIEGDNLALSGPAGKSVTVPANGRVEVRFDAAAAQAGTARFRVAAVAEGTDASDAATIELPVYTPATAEAFATYGTIDSGGITEQPVAAPTDVFPQFGSLDVSTSSTALQALTDAVLYIEHYDYDSSDAMASRILAISSLGDVLQAFDAPGLPSAAEMKGSVNDDIAGLVALQNADGGFPYWEYGRDSEPYNSIQATHALLVAKADGYSVPQATIDAALGFLANIEQYIQEEWGEEAADTLIAYSLFVRNLAGDRDSTRAQQLFDDRNSGKDLPLDALAWIWPVIDDQSTGDAIETIITNGAVDTAGAISFTTDVSDGDVVTLRSDRRTDGLILDDLVALRPQSDMIPKVVKGLLGGQTSGRWDNIQENSFILMAMKHYFDTFEAATPDFVARVWLGDRYAGDHDFSGRTTETAQISISTADVIANGDSNVTIENDGTGRLYYRIGMRTAPSSLDLDPLDRGFTVARTYEAVDDPSDVSRDADGTWHIKAGARVRVRLTMVAESQRTHVALIDPLPAGLEILNPSLATTPDVPSDPSGGCGTGGDVFTDGPVDSAATSTSASTPCPLSDSYFPWTYTWFDHQNLRDDRAEAFTTYLGAGTYDYSYVATATTPGTFVVPPVRAEEMYAPETFGRGATDSVVIDG